MQLNTQPFNAYWFGHDKFAAGGMLEIWLGDKPNKNWGIEFLTTHTDATPIVRMYISGNGYVGIGTVHPTEKLDVRGTISAEEVKVQVLTAVDRVFNTDYDLKPLSEV